MLWLIDSAGAQTAYIPEAASVVVTRRHNLHSEFAARLTLSAFTDADAAYFVMVQGCPLVFLAEHVEIRKDESGTRYVDFRGREASGLLHTRILEGTFTWAGATPGAMVEDILASFTGARALPLAFGTGNTLGTATSLQRSWTDAGETFLEIIAASGLGFRTRMDGATPTLDLYERSTTAVLLGDKHGSGSSSTHVKSIGSWKTYAIVLGQGVGDDRTRVDVDLTGGTLERRELIVDARDLSPDGLTAAQYEAALAERGKAKLEETCKVEYGEADVSAPLEPGSLVYYDAGLWAAEMEVTEATEVREGGMRKYTATLGWREPSVWQTVARVAAGVTNIDGGNVHVVGAVGEPAFANSWVNYDAVSTVQFYRNGLGEVVCNGAAKSGTNGAVAFVLPVGFRPPAARWFPGVQIATAAIGAVYVTAAGEVKLYAVSGGSTASGVALDAVRFIAG